MGKFDGVMIVSDVDGTFLGKDARIVPENLAAIDYFKREGGLFTLATGRDSFLIAGRVPDVRELCNCPVIASNGAYIYDLQSDRIIDEEFLPEPEASGVVDAVRAAYPEISLRITCGGKHLADKDYPLLQDVMERLEATDPLTAAREMNPLPVGHGTVAEALQAYADGQVDALAALKVKQPGTEFRQQVWQAMRLITPGAPVTYGELAQLAERPQAVRAAGSACAENLCAVVVPCHRVVRSGGSAHSAQRTGNYLYGAGTKATLLEFEAAHAGS